MNDTWEAINDSLRKDLRGISGGSSLNKLFIKFGLKKKKIKLNRKDNNKAC